MKKLILPVVLVFAAFQLGAQAFEGTIRWTSTMEITDPKLKAQMEEAEKKMKDPATQAQIKELEAKMNDPEMKKIMDANPGMKAQMENTIKMMKGGGGDNLNMMPKLITVKIKGDNSLSKIEGGMMDGFEIVNAKGKPSCRLLRESNQYTVMPEGNASDKELTADVKITKTSETAKFLNHTCTKYIVEMTERGQKITQFVWATTELPGLDYSKLAGTVHGAGGKPLPFHQIEGVPLKVEVMMPQGTMTMQVTEIKKESIKTEDVTVPAGFTRVD